MRHFLAGSTIFLLAVVTFVGCSRLMMTLIRTEGAVEKAIESESDLDLALE
jgi:hypothetical protein